MKVSWSRNDNSVGRNYNSTSTKNSMNMSWLMDRKQGRKCRLLI